ncbi:MAG: hypothetical protein GY862_26305 [Gammaproteobacteria bacterium]|nr:hypothetical protein [Gammaproteobacteria bacterium]
MIGKTALAQPSFDAVVNNSAVSANAEGDSPTHHGGNVTIRNSGLLLMKDSRITAKAVAGNGGDINITAMAPLITGNNVLDASSEQRLDGQIVINSPDTDLSGLFVLPGALLDTANLVIEHCVKPRERSSRFVSNPLENILIPPDDLKSLDF